MRIVHEGYAVQVEVHGGEDSLIIVRSIGQNGKTPLAVVAAAVDGGVEVLYDGKKKWHSRDEVQTVLYMAVEQWQREWTNKASVSVPTMLDVVWPQ